MQKEKGAPIMWFWRYNHALQCGISTNKSEWITNLIEDYKYVDGEHFGERKHWLNDDYVKFIRLAEHFISKNGEGILAYINNHSFLDNSDI